MKVVRLYRYPVKGLSSELMAKVELVPGHGFPGDRQYAVTDGSIEIDPVAPQPAAKSHFLMLAKYEALAELQTTFHSQPDRLEVRAKDSTREFKLSDEQDRKELAWHLARMAGADLRGEPKVVYSPGHQFTDVSVHSPDLMRSISLINLETVADLAHRVGMDLDPLRFRANLYFKQAAPSTELDWVGQRLQIGGVILKVVRRTRRCPATSVNPKTAVRDINLPLAIREYRENADLGIYASIERGGTILPGDTLTLLPPSDTPGDAIQESQVE
ncbi:MOSC domain-containing protein [Rhizobium tropici]|uniref:MOSC domain-containing protein n=1 Tax=Rhizobium tropici TaxID=398 RepID=A0A5B0W831_RHITR|nr:MOSC domain-containing protein [Rhizobium tropici]KAA1183074.1 MOSC domain-containing protein [Rhizobium tropici]